MPFALTEKGKSLIKTRVFGGQLYARCDRFVNDGVITDLWLKVVPPKIPKCPLCGYEGYSMDEHHIHGRKTSAQTISICSNCHREIHAGIRSLEP
jgi:hypothetical protein